MVPDLTIVIPAYNEAHRLAEGMKRLDAAVDSGAVDLGRTEVVVVDDGSTDGTADQARKLLAPYPHHRVIRCPVNQGKGAAVRVGLHHAGGACTAFMDADMAIDPQAVPLLLDGLADSDVVIGSRALAGSMVERRYVLRSVMGGLFNRLVTTGTGLDLHDTQCGFKGFRTPVGRLLFHLVPIDRFAFDVEVLALAHRLGFTVAEVPVHWKHVAGSTVHPLHDSLSMLADVYRSRCGLRTATPVATLALGDPEGRLSPHQIACTAQTVLDAALPESGLTTTTLGGQVVVLLPLADPADIASATAALQATRPALSVTRRALSAPMLARLGPLGSATGP